MNINLTLLFQVLFFAVFVWFSKKFVWTPVIGALDARKTGIADKLALAEKDRQSAEASRRDAQKAVEDARGEAAEIIRRAEQRGGELVDEAKTRARAEGERLVTAARGEIETEANKAREALRAEVGELAVAGARQILQREIDPKAHAELLAQLAAKLSAPAQAESRRS
ncbi:MAG: F0F1 ATP synthase subunit B [Gammaproteobacteria bacterium]|nr:F0F1 ATP synthase subunit B [Gammaproteobacteria bacterium]CAJ2376807.1 MAG: ATP synthase subunit b [Arenicellales bacterium IbO2]MDA7961685.1 F0F1 ATP synthase subunit B [Gammaproteobacteria bacterium]MDA7968498.1 F0F1 ATP synthase subunit B [Gammaproteobacteria bacterium]MDA7970099.1 F0F1 ATP synthase subunit B [Gammaproteobacteria bacterium]